MAEAKVDTTVADYDAMAAKWSLIDALLGGTAAMRAAGTTLLPMMEREGANGYARRLAGSFLFNGYKDTVRKITAKPFTRPVTVKENERLPEALRSIRDNADREGVSLTQVARELFWIGANRGVAHLLVDYPVTSAEDTRETETQQARRPVFIPLWPDDIIGWQSKHLDSGETVLAQVRVKETETRYDGFGEIKYDRVRVLTADTWEIWEKPETDDEYRLVSNGRHSFDAVPLLTVYFERTGFMTADPPLEDLAYLNLAHWQSSSDQRNILRFARTGVWFMSGVSEEEAERVVLGPSATVWVADSQAKMAVVEHSGSSIEAGERDLRALEEQMQLMGLRPFVSQARGATATGQSINESRGASEIQAWIRVVETLLHEGYAAAAKWIGQELPEGFGVNIYSDFVLSLRAAQDVDALIKARANGDIDRETFLSELKKRGILSEDIVVDEVAEAAAAEGPSLSAAGAGGV